MMSTKKVDEIGFLTLGKKVHVSDPCYETNCWCAGTLKNVFPGRYRCVIERCNDDYFERDSEMFGRVKSIAIYHERYHTSPTEPVPFEVGVDSGQAGFFDDRYYRRYHNKGESEHFDKVWYQRVCNNTIKDIPNPKHIKKIDYFRLEFPFLSEAQLQDATMIPCKYPIYPDDFELEMKIYDAELKYLKEPNSSPTIQIGYAGILDDKCCVASSGYGDGGYECLVGRNAKGQIVSAKIEFIGEDDECE